MFGIELIDASKMWNSEITLGETFGFLFSPSALIFLVAAQNGILFVQDGPVTNWILVHMQILP